MMKRIERSGGIDVSYIYGENRKLDLVQSLLVSQVLDEKGAAQNNVPHEVVPFCINCEIDSCVAQQVAVLLEEVRTLLHPALSRDFNENETADIMELFVVKHVYEKTYGVCLSSRMLCLKLLSLLNEKRNGINEAKIYPYVIVFDTIVRSDGLSAIMLHRMKILSRK